MRLRKVTPVLIFALSVVCLASATEAGYQQARGKIVSMRQALDGEHLILNAEGAPIGSYEQGHLATDAGLHIRKIGLKNGKLLIEGNRVMFLGSTANALDSDRKLRLEVQLHDASDAAVSEFFIRAFLPPQEVDAQLKHYISLLEDSQLEDARKSGKVVGTFQDGRPIYSISKGVTEPPKPVYTPDPEPTSPQHFEVTLIAVINERGFPEYLKVAKTAGEALDRSAIQTVARWRFKPAKKNGSSVASLINIEFTGN